MWPKIGEGQVLSIGLQLRGKPMSAMNHSIYEVYEHQKPELLLHLFQESPALETTIVFARTRDGVHALATMLSHADVLVESLHGSKKPELRDRAVARLKSGEIRVLVTTEAVAREVDLEGVKNVVQFEFHELDEDYRQRLGVTREAGGEVVTFVTPKDGNLLKKLESFVGEEIPKKRSESFSYASQPRPVKIPRKKGCGPNKTGSKPLQHKKPKLKNKGPRRKTGRTRKR